jgi:hypothetical protein
VAFLEKRRGPEKFHALKKMLLCNIRWRAPG